MQVMSEKKMKDVAMFLTNQAEELPPLQNAPDEPRHFETWLPSKLIKSYNWRCKTHFAKSAAVYVFGVYQGALSLYCCHRLINIIIQQHTCCATGTMLAMCRCKPELLTLDGRQLYVSSLHANHLGAHLLVSR